MCGLAVRLVAFVGKFTARNCVRTFRRRTLALLSYSLAAFCTVSICDVACLDGGLSVDRCCSRACCFSRAELSDQISEKRTDMVEYWSCAEFDLVSALLWGVRVAFGTDFDPRYDFLRLFDDSLIYTHQLAVGNHNGALFRVAFYLFISSDHCDFV